MKNNTTMRKIKEFFAVIAVVFLAFNGKTQQLPMYGQYVFNSTIINPAQAGSSHCGVIGVLGRQQWVGMEGAPRTYAAYANIRLPANLGIAGGLYQDNIGKIKELNFQVDVAYHLRLSSTWNLGVGIRAQTYGTSIDLTNFQFSDPSDPWYGAIIENKVFFNTGIGFLLYNPSVFIGFSAPKILRNKFANDVSLGELASELHLFTYGGANLSVNEYLVFTPSFLFKYAHKSPLQADLNLVFGYNETLDFGAMVRSDFYRGLDAVGLLLGITLGQSVHFGYKYEYPMNHLNLVARQTHEVSLRYKWCFRRRHQTASPRYFL